MLISFTLLLMPIASECSPAKNPCTSLVHIGDSTSVGIANQLKINYKNAGFKNVYISAGNGRSIAYKTAPDTMTGIEAVRYFKKKLGKGICWVIALGTNDAASSQKPDDSIRIDSIMHEIGQDRVAWVNVWMDSKTRLNYSSSAARKWNALLSKKSKLFSNIKIVDWSILVIHNPSWFSTDGYHYNSTGSQYRAKLIPLAVSRFWG